VLAVVHAVIAVCIFATGSAALALLLTVVDFPASYLAESIESVLTHGVTNMHTLLVIVAIVDTIVGSAWFFLLGLIVRSSAFMVFKPH
jgi:hypothetical protein